VYFNTFFNGERAYFLYSKIFWVFCSKKQEKIKNFAFMAKLKKIIILFE